MAHDTAMHKVRAGGNDEVGLGRAIAFQQTHTSAGKKIVIGLGRHAGAQPKANAVLALMLARRLRQQNRHHGAQQIDHGGAALLHHSPEA